MNGKLHSEDGAVVCERCTVARNPLTRMRGLLGRRGLAAGEGLMLQSAGSIHTFFMRFPIDAVFLYADQRVLKVAAVMPPWRAAGVENRLRVASDIAQQVRRGEPSLGSAAAPDEHCADGFVEDGVSLRRPTEPREVQALIGARKRIDGIADPDALPL